MAPPIKWVIIIATLLYLGCTAMLVVLVAKKQQRSGHSVVPLVCSLSISLGFLSFAVAGVVQKTCERACTEAWIATFNEDWQPQKVRGHYGWLRYVPNVLGYKDSKIYRDERSWAIGELLDENKPKVVEFVNSMAAPFRMVAMMSTLAWAKLVTFIAHICNAGAVRED